MPPKLISTYLNSHRDFLKFLLRARDRHRSILVQMIPQDRGHSARAIRRACDESKVSQALSDQDCPLRRFQSLKAQWKNFFRRSLLRVVSPTRLEELLSP